MLTVWGGAPDWEAFAEEAGAELRAGVVVGPDVFAGVLVGAVRDWELVEAEGRWVAVGADVRAGPVETAGAGAFAGVFLCPPPLDMVARKTWLSLGG
jgi:hypothetical protein